MLFIIPFLHSQNTISGKMLSTTGIGIPNVSIYLPGTDIGTTSKEGGGYYLKNIPNGNYELIVSYIGKETIRKTITLKGGRKTINFTLQETTSNLNQVVIRGKSANQILRETVLKPTVISLKEIHTKSTNVIDLVGQISGIRVRKQGGVGSASNIMINGISGKGIRTFVDDIPLDLLGAGFNLNNISPNIIKHIEIYKGLVPVEFGTDALGGVIHIETTNRYQNYMEASYTVGSWNTHKVGIGLKRYLNKNKKQFFQVDGFFNHSDNDYWMHDVDLVIDDLYNTKKGKARRFNDAYTSYLGRVQYGFQNVSWADDFRLLLSVSDIDKEWQHGIRAIAPWGEVHGKNSDFNSVVSWKKNTRNNTLKISSLLGYNFQKWKIVDVAGKNYFWDGHFTNKYNKGESGFYVEGRTPKIAIEKIFGRININYKLNPHHTLNFTNLTSFREITGEDKAGSATYKEDFYSKPQNFTKTFFGLSLETKVFNKNITNMLSVKYHYMKNHIANLNEDNSFDQYLDNQYSIVGYGDALKVLFSPELSFYLGYEYALRLPDGEELFGNGITISANPNLVPEKSHNINTGLEFNLPKNNLGISVNGFYRNTKNQIFLNIVSRSISLYDNLLNTKSLGIEATFKINPFKNLFLCTNATWQKITLKNTDGSGKIEPRHIGSRIPNTPYLFANMVATYSFSDVFIKNSRVELSYNNTYVHDFFLAWEDDGSAKSKAKIPTQFTHNASIGYVFPNDKYSINLECVNFTGQLAYDNYKVEKPGRSFYLKLRMYIK